MSFGKPPTREQLEANAQWRRRSATKSARRRARTGDAAQAYSNARFVVSQRSYGACEVNWDSRCDGRMQHAHHILRVSKGGSDDSTNLVGVCVQCHAALHARPGEARERGWLA